MRKGEPIVADDEEVGPMLVRLSSGNFLNDDAVTLFRFPMGTFRKCEISDTLVIVHSKSYPMTRECINFAFFIFTATLTVRKKVKFRKSKYFSILTIRIYYLANTVEPMPSTFQFSALSFLFLNPSSSTREVQSRIFPVGFSKSQKIKLPRNSV
jgi:hypothetical protein